MNITPDMATELDLAPLDWLLGQWEAPGGFREPSGCTRRLVVRHSLGGRFIEIDAENMWPTVAGGTDRSPERTLLQTEGGGFVGVRCDSRRGMDRGEAVLDGETLVVASPEKPDRRVIITRRDGVLDEQSQRQRSAGWTTGFCALLERQTDLLERSP